MTVTIQHLTINLDGGAILLGGLLLLIFILLVRKYK
ncbi:MAG: GlyGly-CTERM sorting domain-containing protein [Fusobacterium sp.]|nr:GlyGly-CTERM sorting domain-containing protein [uncultured Fusobacterium sp.]